MLQSFGLGAEASYVGPLSPSRSRHTESELLTRCRRGDDDAWRELVLGNQDRVITVLSQAGNVERNIAGRNINGSYSANQYEVKFNGGGPLVSASTQAGDIWLDVF